MKWRRIARTLGAILKVFGLTFLVPAAASLWWDEGQAIVRRVDAFGMTVHSTTLAFLLSGAVVFLLGYLLTSIRKPAIEDLREREAFFIVGIGWIVTAALAAVPFLLTRATRDPTVAFFEAMSAITTTGFTALAMPLEQYPPSVHVWRGTLHFFGGVGIVVVAVAIISRLTEGAAKLFGGESFGEVTRLRPKLSQTAKSLFFVYLGLNVLSFTGFVATMHYTGVQLPWREAFYHASVHATSAIATGGMSTRTDSIAAFQSHAVTGVAYVSVVAGAVSIPLYYRAVRGEWFAWARNAELRFFGIMLLLPAIVVTALLAGSGLTWSAALIHGPFQVASVLTTTGLTSANIDAFPDAAKLILLLLMFTGGMVGSTTGAIKLARIQLLLRLLKSEMRRLLHPHAIAVLKAGESILPDAHIRRVVVFFFSYVTVFIAGAVAFAVLGLDLQSSVVAAAASLGNVGVGWDQVAGGFMDPLTPLQRLLGSLLMWMGRLEIFTALLLFLPATYRE